MLKITEDKIAWLYIYDNYVCTVFIFTEQA